MLLNASPILKQASVSRRLPQLPLAVKQGVGVMVGSRIHVGLGSAGRTWMSLDLADRRASWRQLSEFPGLPRDQALAMAFGDELHVFGGAGYDPLEKRYRTFQDVHRYDTLTDTWTPCAATSPVPLLGAAVARGGWGGGAHAQAPHGHAGQGQALFVGGVHDAVFNGFFKDSAGATGEQLNEIVRQYLGMAVEDYRFSSAVLAYEPRTERWTVLGERPGIACVGSALARNGDDVYLMGGETKPGLRSAQAFRLWVADGALRSEQLPDLTGETSSVTSGDASTAAPEGLAGAMAIFSGDSLVLAGGTSFPGARERYLQGQLYAHEHLKKHWRHEILVFENSEWRLVGRLPHGLAHAQMFTWHDEVVIVGGERDGGEACTDVLTLVWGC